MANNENTKKVVVPRQSVHVVFFSCPECGEEAEHIHVCGECGKPMRVINVVEKFGDEAEEFLARLTAQTEDGNGKKSIPVSNNNSGGGDDEQPNVIMLAQDEDTLNDGALIVEDDIDSLDEIYPDDDDDEEKTASSSPEGFGDLDDIVAELDKEEDDEFPLAEELGDEGLPEL